MGRLSKLSYVVSMHYREMVAWIARRSEALHALEREGDGVIDFEEVALLEVVELVSALYGVSSEEVALEVVTERAAYLETAAADRAQEVPRYRVSVSNLSGVTTMECADMGAAWAKAERLRQGLPDVLSVLSVLIEKGSSASGWVTVFRGEFR